MSRFAFEPLDHRIHFAADFSAAINFAPLGSHRVPGMLLDYGVPYGVRRGGLTYGWSSDVTADAVDRNIASVSQRNDTFIAMNQGGSHEWDMKVANGNYKVSIVAGDPATPNEHMAISAEGTFVIAGYTRVTKRWLEGSATVAVTDGKLTVQGTMAADKINSIVIQQTTDPVTVPPLTQKTPITGKLTWTHGVDDPVTRIEAATQTLNNKMYVFGGFINGVYQPTKRCDVYDPATKKWTRIADMPLGTNHAAITTVGTKIWMAGGYTARPGTTRLQDIGTTNVMIYDPATNTWSTGPSLPTRIASAGMVDINNKLYIFSGEHPDRSDRHECYTLNLAHPSAGWTRIADIPQGRTHFAIGVVNNEVYIFGGWVGIDANAICLNTAYKYTPATNKWTKLPNLPLQRSHLSPNSFVANGRMYMLGGEFEWNHELTDVLEYNPATSTYRHLTPLPVARASGVAAYINNQFIFSGGKDSQEAGGFFGDTYIGTFS